MTAASNLDALLGQFARFGVKLGLDASFTLLAHLGHPQKQVPIIHVAGSNGKGSVCAYLSAVLTAAGYRVGRYTSPHLVDWTERICLNDQPIAPADLTRVLHTVIAAIDPADPPTQFEVITAAAWCYFAAQQVDVAVMEVGLGGRLDATNVRDRPLVSVITSISREHWQRLGPTLGHIAYEKAGILKPGCPAVVGPLPPEALTVVQQRATELGCPVVFPAPAAAWPNGDLTYPAAVANATPLRYRLGLAGEIQRTNSAIAIATLHQLRHQGWQIPDTAIQQGLAAARWPGRLQWVAWQGRRLLVDGAHNSASAQVLRDFLDRAGQPPTHWVMGMLTTKDHADIFQILLRPGDSLHLVPIPGHQFADPAALATLALQSCPTLAQCVSAESVWAALTRATQAVAGTPVLCGSLYLIGDVLQQCERPDSAAAPATQDA